MSQVNTFDTLDDYVSLRPYFMQCVWLGYWSWILSFPSFIMNVGYHYNSASNSLETEGLWKSFLAAC